MGKFYSFHNCNHAWGKIVHLSTQSTLERIHSRDKFNDAWGKSIARGKPNSDF
jgi:hypothetical protein